MELKIEKGVPTPSDRHTGGGVRAVFRRMDVEDSIFFETREAAAKFQNDVFSASQGHRATMRKVEGGYRVWKVKREPKPNGHG